jgi:hypothetical protein
MDLNRDDLPHFVRFVLLDEASRPPSGKRQTKPMKAFWMERGGKLNMRGSDQRLRRNICVHALHTIGGRDVFGAAAEVASILNPGTAAQVNGIRVDYHECTGENLDLGFFRSQFFTWRESMFRVKEEALQSILNDYQKTFGKPSRELHANLVGAIKRDPTQKERNRAWLLEPGAQARARIESDYWNPLEHWQHLATDLWELGRLHAAIGETQQAKALLERALKIWKARGIALPHVQAAAIPALEKELAHLKCVNNT